METFKKTLGSTSTPYGISKAVLRVVISLLLLMPFAIRAQQALTDAFRSSYALEKEGKFVEAADKLKAVYQADSYELNLRLGWLTYQAAKLDESVTYYTRAVNLMPYAIEPKFGLAYPYSAQGNWDEIITLYTKILQVDPQNTYANYRLASIYYSRNDFEKARTYAEKVVNLYPFDYDSLTSSKCGRRGYFFRKCCCTIPMTHRPRKA
ncbi:MAG: tetratricopeptide repeat protein [Cyclobacteriaceae bacterium]|nr:tetratricopeptide repeat protein [Cyclobacteriaceae bacterium]